MCRLMVAVLNDSHQNKSITYYPNIRSIGENIFALHSHLHTPPIEAHIVAIDSHVKCDNVPMDLHAKGDKVEFFTQGSIVKIDISNNGHILRKVYSNGPNVISIDIYAKYKVLFS